MTMRRFSSFFLSGAIGVKSRGEDIVAFGLFSSNVCDEPEHAIGDPVFPNDMPRCYNSPCENTIVEVERRLFVGCVCAKERDL